MDEEQQRCYRQEGTTKLADLQIFEKYPYLANVGDGTARAMIHGHSH